MKTPPDAESSLFLRSQTTPSDNPGRRTQQIDDLLSIMARATEREVVFEYAAKQESRVYIAGTFNSWNPTTHPLEYHPESGLFRATLLLETGTHEYKFVVDGSWHPDPNCPHWVFNDSGTINSVITV